MTSSRILVALILIASLYGNEKSMVNALNVLSFVRDLIQYNVAGVPVIHEKTEWNFDPEVGQKRRAIYEADNGRHGEIAIAKVGMGIGHTGPWGTKVEGNRPS